MKACVPIGQQDAERERSVQGKTSTELHFYISSLAPDAKRIGDSIRAHWSVGNRLHWCMDVVFNDDQIRARAGYAAHNLATLKHITLNLIRLDSVKRKGGIKARRLIANTSDSYRAELLGLLCPFRSCDCPGVPLVACRAAKPRCYSA